MSDPYTLVKSILAKTPGDRAFKPGDSILILWQKIVRNRGGEVGYMESPATIMRKFYKTLGGDTSAYDYMTLLRRSVKLAGGEPSGNETPFSLLQKLEQVYTNE